jgi:truncated hemoglobin YjbI
VAEDIAALRAVVSKMETTVSTISELDAEVLEFIDTHYPDMLNDQKVVQVFKSVGDAEDELQRQLNFLRMRLEAGIPDFKTAG